MGDFSLSMDKLLDGYTGNVEKIVKKTVFDLTSSIIKDTPVDSGRARANWQVSFNNSVGDISNNLDKSGSEAISKASTQINSNKIPYVYWIQNNLPYIQRLEYGWSKQSPTGMVRINILRFNKFLRDNTRTK